MNDVHFALSEEGGGVSFVREERMSRTHRHYSPEVRRFLVTVLYHEAKAQKVPMTVLTNQLLERSLRGGEGWRKAQEQCGLQEEPTPYQSK